MNLITIFSTLLLIFSACSKESEPIIKSKQVNVISGERVDLVAFNAESYSWSQLSGIKVILINANTDTLSFIAPDVNETKSLVFEVQALTHSITKNTTIRKERATVTVYPLELTTDTNTTTPIDNNTTLPINPLKSIALTISNNSLNLDTNTTLNAIATYEDNSTKNVTDEVEWISSDLNAIEISKRHLKAKQEKNIILQAKLHAITSNSVALEIYQNINGHRLPPMPNKALNNSTLLGIDSNDNGVRDDVERKIYEEYKEKHPIHIDIAMQAGRAYKQVLETPEKALEIHETVVNAPLYCAWYYQHDADRYGERLLIEERVDAPVKSQYFNTSNRNEVYWEYDTLLSGGSYPLPKTREMKTMCDFNTSKYDKK